MKLRLLPILLLLLTLPVMLSAADDPVRLGERIYREGILPDGRPLMGYIRDDVEIDSTIFSCANCHTRSGIGSLEGQIASPPVSGSYLFSERYQYKDVLKNYLSTKKKGVPRSAKPIRPAYDEKSLSLAIAGGINSAGRELLPVMPRYDMTDAEMGVLIAYLKTLSATHSPGVDDEEMHIATIVTDDVSESDRNAMLIPLKRLVEQNRQAASLKTTPRYQKFARMLDEAFFRKLRLSVWELTGDPSTWGAQLERFYQKDPPFAILGGISTRDWRPIHEFCERMQLPDILPITDYPVISDTDWYTIYFSRGHYQEGETAARYIAQQIEPSDAVLIISGTDERERRMAQGAVAAFTEKGFDQLIRLDGATVETLRPKLSALFASRTVKGVVAAVDDRLLSFLLEGDVGVKLPSVTVASATLASRLLEQPDDRLGRILLTWPYRLPDDERKYAEFKDTFLMGRMKPDGKRIASRTFSMIHVFMLGVREMKLDFYRDTLLDQISMMQDQYLPDFERLSFGPGQRYLSKGCYVVQVEPKSGKLIPRSDWVIH